MPKALTTERIFAAYLQVAHEVDNHKDISLAKIAEKLGVSRQAIFKNHFQNISELTHSMHYYVDSKPYQRMKDFIDSQNCYDFSQLLNFFAEVMIPALYNRREFLQIFYSQTVGDSSWRPYLNQRYVALLVPYFDQADGNAHGLPSRILAELSVNQVMVALSLWLTSEEPEGPEEFGKHFIYLFSHSLLALAEKK